MSISRASTRIGLFTLLFSVIVLSLFGGLWAADRALTRADQESVTLDAHGAALVAERELRLKAEALTLMFDPLLPSWSNSSRRDSLMPPPGFDGVWVLDPRGRVVWRQGRAAGVGDVDAASVVDLALAATPDAWPRVHAIPGARDSVKGGMLLAVPLTHRGQVLGAAVGVIAGAPLLHSLQDTTVNRARLALRVAGKTVATVGGREWQSTYVSDKSPIRVSGDIVEVEVAHAQTGRALRTTLWALGAVALAAILAGLARERRQAMNLAGRTTELERLYQEVARSNRMKSEFLANVSHELRTPLNAIVGFVEMLREGVYGELTPRQALPVERIAASATHLRHLVDRLLDIAKIAAGRLEVHPEPLVLRPFVLNVASEMESLVSERGLALSIAVGPSLPRIRTDQTHLRQILINLIGNAVKYTPSGGINVKARLIGNGSTEHTQPDVDDADTRIGGPPDPTKLWVALQVTDTGVGIASVDLERIFDEFEQVNAGARTDSARRGTGLGLAISRRLARLIGGDLTVISEVGRGSAFTVWLPLDATEKRAD